MTTDTKLNQLIINKLTQAQYDGIETKNPDEFYCVTDAGSDSDLENKLDLNFQNATKATYSRLALLSSIFYEMPTTLTFNTTLTTDGEEKTMTYSGLFTFSFVVGSAIHDVLYFFVNDNIVGFLGATAYQTVAHRNTINFPVNDGDVVKVKAEQNFTATGINSYLYPSYAAYLESVKS